MRQKLFEKDRRHVNTTSDSEVLLNVLAHEIDTVKGNVTAEDVFRAISNVHRTIRGAYAVAAMIIGHGMIAFRDPHGIRPLCLGKREVNGQLEYMVASESVALDAVGFDFVQMSRPVKRFMPLSMVSSTPNSVPIIQHSTHASLNLSTLRALIRLSTRFPFTALV